MRISGLIVLQNILITAYSPLGTPDSPEAGFSENVSVPKPMDDPLINKIAKDLGKSPAQVWPGRAVHSLHCVNLLKPLSCCVSLTSHWLLSSPLTPRCDSLGNVPYSFRGMKSSDAIPHICKYKTTCGAIPLGKPCTVSGKASDSS